MSRRWKMFVFTTALLAATLGPVTFASARTDDVKVLHLTSSIVESHFVDVAPTGDQPTVGDSFIFSEDLSIDGDKAGIDAGICTIARVAHGPVASQCVITAHLAKGDMTAQGITYEDRMRNVYAITGGTGRYRDAGGYVVVRETSETVAKSTVYLSHLR